MRLWILGLVSGLCLGAVSIEGHLENGTTGGLGRADSVQLIRLGQGMEVIASAKDVSGSFKLEFEGDLSGQRLLVQAHVGRAVYTHILEDPSQPFRLKMYESSESVPLAARVGSLALFAREDKIDIGFFYNLDNQSNPPQTLERSDHTYRFPVPQGYESLEASTRRGSMPLRQQLVVKEGFASISYPIKPGRTQLMVRAHYPYLEDGTNEYLIPLLDHQKFMHVLAMPVSLELEGEGLEFVNEDPKQGVKLYEWSRTENQTVLKLRVWGKAASQGDVQNQQQAEETPHRAKIERRSNLVGSYKWWILGSVLSLLAAATLLGIRRS